MDFWPGVALGFGVGMVTRFWLLRAILLKFEARGIDREARLLVREHGDDALSVAIQAADKERWECNEHGAVFWLRVARRIDRSPLSGPIPKELGP